MQEKKSDLSEGAQSPVASEINGLENGSDHNTVFFKNDQSLTRREVTPLFSTELLLASIKEDPDLRKNFNHMCIKQYKINLEMNQVELYNRQEEHAHMKRKNLMELEFLSRKQEQELEFQRKLSELDLWKRQHDLGVPSNRSDNINNQNAAASSFNRSASVIEPCGILSNANVACSSQKRIYKLRHVICHVDPALVESKGIVIMAKASPCTRICNKVITIPHAHYIIDETNCRDHAGRIIKKMKCNFVSSLKIRDEKKLRQLLNEFQAHCKPFASTFNVKNLSEYF